MNAEVSDGEAALRGSSSWKRLRLMRERGVDDIPGGQSIWGSAPTCVSAPRPGHSNIEATPRYLGTGRP